MKILKLSAITLAALMTSACSANFLSLDVKPSNAPMYNMTRSSHVLACVGSRIDQTPTPPMDVFISDIPDHTTSTIETGFLTKNAVMMVTTAVDRLGTSKVSVIGRNGANRLHRQVQILGAWTEINRTTGSNALNGKAVFPEGWSWNFSGDRSMNHIALDMAMSEGNRIIPTTSTSVSIQINKHTGNTTLTYDNGGDFAAVGALGFTAQEGFHAAERLLIETSVAVMMAKYYGIDVKDCLQPSAESLDPQKIDAPVFTPPPAAPASEAPIARPSLIFSDKPPNFESDVGTLPTQNGVVVVPLPDGTKRILPAQPQEYTDRRRGDYSGTHTTDNSGTFISE